MQTRQTEVAGVKARVAWSPDYYEVAVGPLVLGWFMRPSHWRVGGTRSCEHFGFDAGPLQVAWVKSGAVL